MPQLDMLLTNLIAEALVYRNAKDLDVSRMNHAIARRRALTHPDFYSPKPQAKMV